MTGDAREIYKCERTTMLQTRLCSFKGDVNGA